MSDSLLHKKPYELDHRYQEYDYIYQNNSQVFLLWKQNVLLDDFAYSRRSALALIFVPGSVNLLITRFKPNFYGQFVFSCGCFLGMLWNFSRQYYKDVEAFVEKDTPLANQMRLHLQNVAYFNTNQADYLNQTMEILEERGREKA